MVARALRFSFDGAGKQVVGTLFAGGVGGEDFTIKDGEFELMYRGADVAFRDLLAQFELKDHEFSNGDEDDDIATLRTQIDAIVADLSRRVAAGFHAFYWRHLHRFPSTAIFVDENDPFPWELVRPSSDPAFRPAVARAPLLGQRFAIGRSSLTNRPRARVLGVPLEVRRLLAIAPEMAPCAAGADCSRATIFNNQYAQIEKYFLEKEALDRTTALLATLRTRLADGGPAVVHYMGHSYLDPTNHGASWLKLVGKQRSTGWASTELDALIATSPADGESRWPWVFINACDAGAFASDIADGEPAWTYESWGKRFRSAGAGATIAPYWNVSSQFARDVAKRFYRYLDGGESIGGALRRIRLLFSTSNDRSVVHPTLLAYTLYGDPTTTVNFADEPPG